MATANNRIGTTPEEISEKHKGTNCECPYCKCPRCGNDAYDDKHMVGTLVCTHPWHDQNCPNCDAAKRHAYSDATTPGFFFDKCSKHREPEK